MIKDDVLALDFTRGKWGMLVVTFMGMEQDVAELPPGARIGYHDALKLYNYWRSNCKPPLAQVNVAEILKEPTHDK